jgi:hypothetical protein
MVAGRGWRVGAFTNRWTGVSLVVDTLAVDRVERFYTGEKVSFYSRVSLDHYKRQFWRAAKKRRVVKKWERRFGQPVVFVVTSVNYEDRSIVVDAA